MKDLVLGLDGYKHRWLGIVLRDGHFDRARVYGTIAEALKIEDGASVVGIDVPIGLGQGCGRAADHEARRFVGSRGSSVFPTFPAAVLACVSHKDAADLARQLTGKALSRQSYALRDKISEAELAAENDDRVVEVHPEVSFRALAGKNLAFSKKTWNGQEERHRLLRSVEIEIPEVLQGAAGKAPVDDVTSWMPPSPLGAHAAWLKVWLGRSPSASRQPPEGERPA